MLDHVLAMNMRKDSNVIKYRTGETITQDMLNFIENNSINEIKIFNIGSRIGNGASIIETLIKDKNKDQEAALIDM